MRSKVADRILSKTPWYIKWGVKIRVKWMVFKWKYF